MKQNWQNYKEKVGKSIIIVIGLPLWLSNKESACSTGEARDIGSIPGLGRPLGEENGTPLQYSCLGNPMDRGTWQATVHEVAKESDMTEGLSTNLT